MNVLTYLLTSYTKLYVDMQVMEKSLERAESYAMRMSASRMYLVKRGLYQKFVLLFY